MTDQLPEGWHRAASLTTSFFKHLHCQHQAMPLNGSFPPNSRTCDTGLTDITDIVDASGPQDWQGCLRHWHDILNLNKLSGSIFYHYYLILVRSMLNQIDNVVDIVKYQPGAMPTYGL